MVMTVGLSEWEQNIPTSNKLINDLIAEVRQKTGENWQVLEMTFTHKKWFKTTTYKSYELLIEVGGCFPFQVINFYRSDSDTEGSINPRVSDELIVSYLYGILSGIQSMELKNVQKNK